MILSASVFVGPVAFIKLLRSNLNFSFPFREFPTSILREDTAGDSIQRSKEATTPPSTTVVSLIVKLFILFSVPYLHVWRKGTLTDEMSTKVCFDNKILLVKYFYDHDCSNKATVSLDP